MSFGIKHKMSCFQRDCGGKKQRKQIKTVYRKLLKKKNQHFIKFANYFIRLQNSQIYFIIYCYIIYVILLKCTNTIHSQWTVMNLS